MSAQKRYNTYRQTFPEFVYQDYEYTMQSDGLHMCFHFKLSDKLCFAVRSSVPTRQFINFSIPKDQLDLLVFNIGMAELVSYWKAFCPPLVRIVPHGLTEEQKCFWKKLYFNGLGEFFYVNGIRATIDDFMTIEAEGEPLKPVSFSQFDDKASESFIVPIGGGKDSVVTLDCLQSYSARLQLDSPLPLIMNPRGATVECCRVAGYEHGDFLEIRRAIDPLLLDLNAKGALNGHTPFSAMLAFYTLLVSALTGRRHIALSNESSANEATDIANGVNHQYSKSLEFENDFRDYVSSFISPRFDYFSFLRPLSELQIAMLFSRLPQYHDVFRSCNVGSKQDVWCGHCAKCLFAFIILSPFISPDRLAQIFGHNLLDDETLMLYFRQLAGLEPVKPFECVGTVAEVNTALRMTVDRWYANGEVPCLLRDFQPQGDSVSLSALASEHNLTEGLMNILVAHVV